MRTSMTALGLAFLAKAAVGQSITAGGIIGTVTERFGQPLPGVHVILTETTSGLTRETETGRAGGFSFELLSPGEYEVFAERLGDRPVRIEGVPVAPGRRVTLAITLEPAPPPVEYATVTQFHGQELQWGGRDGGRLYSKLELSALPAYDRSLAEVGRYSSASDASLSTEGLPGRFAGVVVDGVAYQAAVHEDLPTPDNPGAPLSLYSAGRAELLANGIDVEYSGFAGASLVSYSKRGTRRLQVGTFGDWAGDAAASSKYFEPGDVSHNSLRAGFYASGPVVPDTAHFYLGVEGRRFEIPAPPSWEASSIDSTLVAVAGDSFGIDLGAYLAPRLTTTDMVSGHGRLDWRIGTANAVVLRLNAAAYESTDPELGSFRAVGLDTDRKGTDLSGLFSLTSSLSRAFGLEQRLGVEYGKREHSAAEVPYTVLTAGPSLFGTDPVLPGDFQRFGFRASETIHIGAGNHQLKLGGGAAISSISHTYAALSDGAFVFSGIDDFAGVDGVFARSVGQVPVAKFTAKEFGAYLQDTWSATPGLDLTLGVRLDWELLPYDEVPGNDRWLELTGLSNAEFDNSIFKVSPRFGALVRYGAWEVRANATIHHGSVSNALFSELVTRSGDIEMQRGAGLLGSWPDSPDLTVAPVMGATVSLLGPDFQAPRTARSSVTITAALGGGVRLDLSGAYRHTDFLPRRHDLNLITSPAAADQYGRPVYGTLAKYGGVLVAEPGSNRRFSEFDLVSALDPDGYSDYWGITGRLERRFGAGVTFFASYTYSETRDNWLSGLGGEPEFQLGPFPDSLGGADWVEGRSDFDFPHRFTFGANLDFGLVRLAGFFRSQSGIPFTPGFRTGVDANADGSFRNDPAFVDDEVEGISDLFAEWECLRGQVGHFAERNSCGGPTVRTLDIRLVLAPVKLGTYPLELVIDGLNLLDPDIADPDRALYLVDAEQDLDIDPVSGVVTVPLVANQDFGKPMVRRSHGRAFRVGLRINYD